MKTINKLFLSIILIIVFSSVIAFTSGIVGTKSNTLLDSTDSESFNLDNQDVTQMFNERGFYKSNSANFDENEVISDFSGNLMYEIPLYNFKHAGEMQYEVKLVYNGSVGHEVHAGNETSWNLSGQTDRYNFNAPEWILSLNGIAIQVFNFETNFFSNQYDNGSQVNISGKNVHLLIPGYHSDGKMRVPESGELNRIFMLMGDGSMLTLINKTYGVNGNQNWYTGVYHSEGKESYIWADVSFLAGQSGDDMFKNREVQLHKGDGLVYVFREYKQDFIDFNIVDPSVGVVLSKRPRMMLLEEIRDRFGYWITLGYNTSVAPGTFTNTKLYGHPLLTSVGANASTLNDNNTFSIAYNTGAIKIFNSSTVNGNYRFGISPQVFYTSSDDNGTANHIATITKISNPLNQDAIVAYENNQTYYRQFNSIPKPGDPGVTLNYNFTNLMRLKNYTNYLGGYREYTYFEDNGTNTNNKTINYGVITYGRSHAYLGYGRDPFYNNMLTDRIIKENGSQKSETTYSYSYNSNGRGNTGSYPIDINDIYNTTIIQASSQSSTINNSEPSIQRTLAYTVFPVRYPDQQPGGAEPSVTAVNGVTKLKQEDIYKADNSLYQSIAYTYETGTNSFEGSF